MMHFVCWTDALLFSSFSECKLTLPQHQHEVICSIQAPQWRFDYRLFFLLGIVTIALVKITQTTQSNLLTTRSKKLHQISYWQVGERLFITATTGHLSSVKWPWSKQCNKRENKQVTYRSCTTSKHGYHKIFDLLQNQVRLSW